MEEEVSRDRARFSRLLDAWVCTTFHVLPTSEEFTSLYYEQKIALYEASLRLVDQGTLRRMFYTRQRIEEVEQADPSSFLPRAIARTLRQVYEAQGMPQEEIDARLRKQAESIKMQKVREVRKELGELA